MNKETDIKKNITVGESIVVKDFAKKMDVKVTDLIALLMSNKIFVNLNESIDFDTAVLIGESFGVEVVKKQGELEKSRSLFKNRKYGRKAKKRPPVVVVMGHVDHGKTTLLDKILSTEVALGETGGITQHVSAYQVKKRGQLITFMDTPGHEAFNSIRERGAYVTDLAVIVVAADDGVKPQTKEAVSFAKSAGLPIIVAINKIDKPEANIEKVKKELSEIDLLPEEWGGNTVCVNISGKTGEGIDNLLEMILLYTDMEELKAEYDVLFEGFIIESYLNPQVGPIVTVLVQNGTMNVEDYIAAGPISGRIKIIKDFQGKQLRQAGPSSPVVVLGLNETPKAGLIIKAFRSRKMAEAAAAEFSGQKDNKIRGGGKIISALKVSENQALLDSMEKVFLIIKADTKGSLEAVIQILESIRSENVAIYILKTGVGEITETDIKLAQSVNAKIVGFNNNIDSHAKKFAEKEQVDFRIFQIIYELAAYVKDEMSLLLGTEIIRTDLGKMKVLAVFKLPKKSAKTFEMIFGAKVEKGKVEKNSQIEVWRNGELLGDGVIRELQHNKKALSELKSGNNAGITYYGSVVLQEGDDIVVYKNEERKKTI